MIEMLLAMALAGGPDAQAVPPKPVGGSIAGLFSADDYPRGAIDRDEQGTTQVIIHIDETGAVSSCEIKVSSGFPDLDTQTCTIIAERANFLPARDAKGRAVTSELPESIAWRLEVGKTPSGPWNRRVTISYGPDGTPTSCKVESTTTTPIPAQPAACAEGIATEPATSLPGVPRGVQSISMLLEGTPGTLAPLTLERGERLLARNVAAMSVDPMGHVISCESKESSGPLARADSCASPVISGDLEVRKDADGKPVPYVETVATSLIARTASADGSRPKH